MIEVAQFGTIIQLRQRILEIDHEIISTVILLPSAESFKKGCCQLQEKVWARITGKLLVQACAEKSVAGWTDRPAMTIAVDLGRIASKQTNEREWNIKGRERLCGN